MDGKNAKAGLIVSMALFGTIGVFVRGIGLPSSVIAMARGLLGAAFLLLAAKLRSDRPDRAAIRKNAVPLLISGTILGLNWILLFEAYRFTTVATATLCYYLAPVLVVLSSPLLLGERLTPGKLLAIAMAFGGMVFISGAAQSGLPPLSELRGVLLALGAAVLYAAIMILNKRIRGLGAFDRTAVQLLVTGVVLIPYCLLRARILPGSFTLRSALLLGIVCVVHTGLAYMLFFGAMEHVSAQSVSMLGYIDPVVAVLCSVVILREEFTVYSLIGTVLILGGALVSELPGKK